MNTPIRNVFAKSSTFVELATLVKQAKEDVTFMGHRYVYFDNYNGTLPIDSLAVKAIQFVSNNHSLDVNEQKAAAEIVTLINKIYEHNNARWKNPITVTLSFIRDRCLKVFEKAYYGYDARYFWSEKFCQKGVINSTTGTLPEVLVPYVIRENIEDALVAASTFEDLLPIARKTKENISLMGSRFVQVEGYEGTLPVNALARRVMELVSIHFDYAQDKNFQDIVPLIDAIYLQSGKRGNDANILTRASCFIRDSWSGSPLKDDVHSQWMKVAKSTQATVQNHTV